MSQFTRYSWATFGNFAATAAAKRWHEDRRDGSGEKFHFLSNIWKASKKTPLTWIRSVWRELVSVCMSLGCIGNDIVRIETSYASGDQRHLVQEYQYVVKDAKERYLVFDIINSEIFDN